MSETNLNDPRPIKLDLAAIREKLASAQGKHYWRSLEELASTEQFEDFLHREFPREASVMEDAGDRRNFLKVMGASLALAGLGACTRQPTEHIMPYTKAPEQLIPGRPLFYSTAMPLSGTATGLLAESHEGRPTKIEGNPDHPGSLGACDGWSQAAILQLYDPDRSQTITKDGEITSWGAFSRTVTEAMTAQRAKGGAGLRILTETVNSPTLAAQINALLKELPGARWHQFEPAGGHSARAGAELVFGQAVNTYYDFSKAEVIVSLDCDFLASTPGTLRYTRQFSSRRKVSEEHTAMSRLYMVETMPSPTGTKADHRMPLRAQDVENFALALASAMAVDTGARKAANAEVFYKWMGPLFRDLQMHKGATLIVAGDQQPPLVHALVHQMNAVLGNVGKTVFYTDPIEASPVDQFASLNDLVKDLDAGAVDLLLVLGGNPVYSAPVELGFRDRLKKAKLRVHLSQHEDETSEYCQWHVPETHFLETWSDARAFDGTVTIMQPLIQPLYGGRSAHEVLVTLSLLPDRKVYDVIREFWASQQKGDFQAWWNKTVHDGVAPNTALPVKTVAVRAGWAASLPAKTNRTGMEIVFRPDPAIYDGRFANNGWLQEWPRPITKVTWDNPAIVSPATAQQYKLQNGSVVELTYQGRKIKVPVVIQPGHAVNSMTLFLGYGRTRGGRVANGIGFNAYGIRTASALWSDRGAEIKLTGEMHDLSITQNHHIIDSARNIVHIANIGEFKKNPEVIQEHAETPPPELTIYPGFKYEGYAWGMSIDTNACTGCGACVVACQSENNIPVVGKDQVRRGRAMHWIRVDSYFQGGMDNPEIVNQPMTCQQCENAPCELVCPVQATAHSSEGLNDMVYNRCVGPRYCSNNCPYKVRRFNFLLYQDFETPSLKLGRNPDVSVRSRGVMEKCTYCVQRINSAKIDAEREDRKVRDGEIQTACQATCPADAIVFGNINDKGSRVSKLKAEKLSYGVLSDINTRPRTTYMATLRNPNPEIES